MYNTLKTALAVTLIATTASATSSTITSESTTGDLPNICEFSNAVTGAMAWDETNNVFNQTTPPSVTMKVRDVTSVVTDTDKVLYSVSDSATADNLAEVSYGSSTATPKDSLRSLVASGNTVIFVVDQFDQPQYFDMTLNHTAVPSQYFVAKDLTTYRITHTITCNF